MLHTAVEQIILLYTEEFIFQFYALNINYKSHNIVKYFIGKNILFLL